MRVAISMLASGERIKLMGKVHTGILTGRLIPEDGAKIKSMGLDDSNGQTGEFTKGNTKVTKNMGMAPILGLTDRNTRDIGRRVIDMEREQFEETNRNEKEFGSAIECFIGLTTNQPSINDLPLRSLSTDPYYVLSCN